MTDTKTWLIVAGFLLILWLNGCFSSAQASTNTGGWQGSPPISTQDCYDQAQGIVSPSWAGMNKIQRAVLAIQVINTCEGK